MNHVVHIDAKSNELDNLLRGNKSMIIRGGMGRKVPYGKVTAGDILYFINNNAEGVIKAKGVVSSVFDSRKMTKDESIALVNEYQDKLQLTDRQFHKWAGKRYIILTEVNKLKVFGDDEIWNSPPESVDITEIVKRIGTGMSSTNKFQLMARFVVDTSNGTSFAESLEWEKVVLVVSYANK